MKPPDDGPKVVGFVWDWGAELEPSTPGSALERSAACRGHARDPFLSVVDTVRDDAPCCTSKLISSSMPPQRKQCGRILFGKDHFLESARGVARRLREASLNEGQRRLVPATHFEVVRDDFDEIDQSAQY